MRVQVIQMLWNLFDLAPKSADKAAALSSSGRSDVKEQEQQQAQEQQQTGNTAEADNCSSQQVAACQEAPGSAVQRNSSRVAQQLVEALASALQQQVSTCSSLQVGEMRSAEVFQDRHTTLKCRLVSPLQHTGKTLLRLCWCGARAWYMKCWYFGYVLPCTAEAAGAQ